MDSTSKLLVIALVLLCLCCSSSAAAYGAGKVIKADEEQIKKELKELELEKHRIANPMRVETETKGFALPKGLVGRYNASSLSKDGKTWEDLSSQGNDIKSGNRKGKFELKDSHSGVAVHGSTSDGFYIPHEIQGRNWTFFAVAKYAGDTTGRIFQSKDTNWAIGWHGGTAGIYYAGEPKDDKGGWIVPSEKGVGIHALTLITAQRDLFRSTTGSEGSKHGTTRNTKNGSRDKIGKIGVNMGFVASETSEWDIYEMLIFSKKLEIKDIKVVEEYLADKYLLTETPDVDIKQGHGKVNGAFTHIDKTPWFENTGTIDFCRRQAAKHGYKMWGHRNEKHDKNDWRNKCFFFDNPVEVKEEDSNDKSHIVGCTAEGVELSNACKPESEKND
tara:strand:- start:888 stop:2051 length:1164 start_codon:yes stop_codon:yes gene_type:complete